VPELFKLLSRLEDSAMTMKSGVAEELQAVFSVHPIQGFLMLT
jgi:hypothetical protein